MAEEIANRRMIGVSALYVIAGLDPEKSCRDWRNAVDQRLVQIYCITMEDANHWQSNEAPFDFVEWFGNKYGLDPKSAVGL